jgi:5-methylcytosine-specific restriction endonuclease McrA
MLSNEERYVELAEGFLKVINRFHRGLDKFSETICADCQILQEKEEALNKAEEEQAAKRVQELKTMPYKEYLQTPEWQAIREKSLEIAGYRCEVCNAEKSIDIHHRTYERRGEECSGDLVALCRSCHTLFHKAGKLK